MNDNSKDVYIIDIKAEYLKYTTDEIINYAKDCLKSDSDYIFKLISDITQQIPARCTIKAGYRLLPVGNIDSQTNQLSLNGVIFDTGQIVSGSLKDSIMAAVFILTIGSDMENWSRHMIRIGDPLKSYLIDSVASYIVDKSADFVHEHIGKEMFKDDLNITNRYSPGNCDWNVSDQLKLFTLLPDNFCDVQLNESALMTPIKSLSGIIGIGPDSTYKSYPCERCSKKDCSNRAKNIRQLLV